MKQLRSNCDREARRVGSRNIGRGSVTLQVTPLAVSRNSFDRFVSQVIDSNLSCPRFYALIQDITPRHADAPVCMIDLFIGAFKEAALAWLAKQLAWELGNHLDTYIANTLAPNGISHSDGRIAIAPPPQHVGSIVELSARHPRERKLLLFRYLVAMQRHFGPQQFNGSVTKCSMEKWDGPTE